MKPHEERVVEERRVLDENIAKLNAFIKGDVFPTVGCDEQERLVRQLSCMEELSGILRERIAAFDL